MEVRHTITETASTPVIPMAHVKLTYWWIGQISPILGGELQLTTIRHVHPQET